MKFNLIFIVSQRQPNSSLFILRIALLVRRTKELNTKEKQQNHPSGVFHFARLTFIFRKIQ